MPTATSTTRKRRTRKVSATTVKQPRKSASKVTPTPVQSEPVVVKKEVKSVEKVRRNLTQLDGFELAILSKLNDDALQITEQILPYFQPAYNVTVTLVETIKEKRDIPIILENVTMQDDYEGNYTTRRVLLYTLRFSAKTYLFGPVTTATSDIVKKTSVRYLAGGSKSTERDITYSVTPRAIKNYTGTVLTNLVEDISLTDLTINVEDGSTLTASTYVEVDGEELYVTSISGNAITVERGKDSTTAIAHLRGAEVKSITDADDALIEMGDDFGFSGEYTSGL